jgi:predicted negative regulator of RcsB-dependent stress response
MSDPSTFNRQPLQEAPLLVNPGLLDQLGLPPKVVRYLRENQRRAWIITGCVVALIAAVSLYDSYTAYRDGKAASALSEALKADEAAKAEMLQKVADDYGSAAAGLWASIEIAQLSLAKGETDRAIAALQEVRKGTDRDNPLTPLLLVKLAGLHETKGEQEQALALYDELSRYQGFEAGAYEAMGRIYEQQAKKDKALEMYQKYLALGKEEGASSTAPAAPAAADPERQMIQDRITALQEQ